MISLRLVLDTNIVVSAAIKPEGLQRSVVLLALAKPSHLYVSQPILTEYALVLGRPELKIRRTLQRQLMQLIENRARRVRTFPLPAITADPADNIFVECADAARADYIVTGNPRHFPKYWKSTKVVTSREFLEIVGPHLVD
jgi:uncharacterized protein